MTVFFNFFAKTIAFFTALAIFILLLSILLSSTYSRFEAPNSKFKFTEGNENSNNTIALIKLQGPILNEPLGPIEFSLFDSLEAIYVEKFKQNLELLKKQKPKAIILSINSPGGTVSATHNLYNAIYDFKKNNETKIFVHTNELLASGGYWAALASDKIYASYGAMIGSIGVKGPEWIYFDQPISISTGIFGSAVETKEGIKKFNTIAGRSKDLLNSFRKPTKEEIESLQSIVNGIYEDFVFIVGKNRKIEKKFITNDVGALIYDSKKAKEFYLIDDVKNLKNVKNSIVKELKLKDYKIIEKIRKKSFFSDLIQSSLLMKYNNYNLREERICGLINSYISVIFIDSKLAKNC